MARMRKIFHESARTLQDVLVLLPIAAFEVEATGSLFRYDN